MRRRFRRVALAITAVAVMAIAGGVTYAVADVGDGGVINGCYKSQNGQLRLIDPATDSCHPSETSISWGQTGTQGPRAEGRQGRQGRSGRTRYAPLGGDEQQRHDRAAKRCRYLGAGPQWCWGVPRDLQP